MAGRFTMNFVCFECRRSFSQPYIENVSAEPRLCPVCRSPMTFTGPDYKPPASLDSKAWTLDKALAGAWMLAFSPRYAYGVAPENKISTLREFHIWSERDRQRRINIVPQSRLRRD